MREEMENMDDFIRRASEAYYQGNPIISDATFDILSATYRMLDVGYHVKNGIPHFNRMYSLQKCYDLAKAPIPVSDCIATPKLDGLAVSLLYVEGKFRMGLTRGDGNLGHDITDKIKYLIPEEIDLKGSGVQVTGEVVAGKDVPNSRNFAAGSMNLKDMDEFLSRVSDLCFFAYDVEPSPAETYKGTLEYLAGQGFSTVDSPRIVEQFPTDGEVYRLNSNSAFNRSGYTSHHPRGAFAFKTQAEGRVTKLIGVDWQVGRTGVISPVALLEPVKIGEATVSRATLHNAAFIEKLDLELGCDVEVVRSGEIIPCIVRKVT